MTTTTAISANAVRNDGATILGAGNVSSTRTNTLSLSDNMVHQPNLVFQAASPNSSGNLGTFKPLSAGIFAFKMAPGQVIAKGVTDQLLAGAISYTVYNTNANVVGRQAINRFYGYQRLHITSWNASTGAATYGAQRGVTTLASGIDGTTGVRADTAASPTSAIPGELVYMVKGTTATEADYSAKTGAF